MRCPPPPLPLHQLPHAHIDSLTLQSGCVGLASSLQYLWVLGAGQTIFVEQADAVHAVRDDAVSEPNPRPHFRCIAATPAALVRLD